MKNDRKIYEEAELSNRAKQVYLYLRDRADAKGYSFPSQKRIAKDLSISVRTVQRAIKDLEKSGHLQKEDRFRENGGRSSCLYWIVK
ncbi:helix-turn-helix domain-containing protein [Chakrabartyella piscis]|uniref:helix-turn-helix domain-containing protein n=1 Tax=Chakrabartyella piscis TaxID=2918914 RepID=UPI002958447F|nr:helix-turn-helix domain-containing protein [Chakrabartyella piscis]